MAFLKRGTTWSTKWRDGTHLLNPDPSANLTGPFSVTRTSTFAMSIHRLSELTLSLPTHLGEKARCGNGWGNVF